MFDSNKGLVTICDSIYSRINKRRAKLTSISLRIASVVFVLGIVVSLWSQPSLLINSHLSHLAFLTFILVPISIFINGLEYFYIAKLGGAKEVELKGAIAITIIGSAANMLPLPGALAVRIGAMKAKGITVKRGAYLSILGFGLWGGVAACISAISMFNLKATPEAYYLIICGVIGIIVSLTFLYLFNPKLHLVAALLFQRLSMVLLDALRMYICLLALGIDIELLQSGLLVLGSLLGSAVSIVPAGLGVREVVTATLAPYIGVTAAAGFMAATLNRIFGLAVVSMIAYILSKK